MKSFFSCIDTGFIRQVPQSLQHLAISDKAAKAGGKISFYAGEDFETLKSQGVARMTIARNPNNDGVVFFRLYQFCYGGSFDFKYLTDLLDRGYEVHFARENISILNRAQLDNLYPMLFSYNVVEQRNDTKEIFEFTWAAMSRLP